MGRQAIINCDKLQGNIERIKAVLPKEVGIIAVVKGEAYGHGLRAMSKELSMNKNIVMLAVSSLEEARAIATVRQDILIMYPVYTSVIKKMMGNDTSGDMKKILEEKVIFTVGSLFEFKVYKELASQMGIRFRVHLRLDFQGGVRGFSKKEFQENYHTMIETKELEVCGLYAHVYSTYSGDRKLKEEELQEYAEVFDTVGNKYKDRIMKHILTSPSFEEFPEYSFDAVRVGAALYGMPTGYKESNLKLDCVMSISANIVNIVEKEEDMSLDYSGQTRDIKKVGLLPIGNWDIPHFFRGDECRLRVNGVLTTLAGEACMDTCCVDVTNVPNVAVGDTVYFLDDQPGITFQDKMKENGYTMSDCQMLYVGAGRLPKIYSSEEQ